MLPGQGLKGHEKAFSEAPGDTFLSGGRRCRYKFSDTQPNDFFYSISFFFLSFQYPRQWSHSIHSLEGPDTFPAVTVNRTHFSPNFLVLMSSIYASPSLFPFLLPTLFPPYHKAQ